MDDITIGVTEFVNNILVSAQPNDQTIDITVTETVETVLLDVSTTVQEVTVTATQNVIVENITVDYVNNENNIDINVTDGTQDVTLNVTPTLVEINILRSGGEVNILQFNTRADFPTTGSIDYFYLAKDTNKLYRWTGSAYAEIAATANARWGEIIGTLSEQTDLQNALNLKAPINSPTFTGTVSGITKVMVGLGAVDNTSDLDKPISNATQTALNNKQPLDADLTSIAALSGTFGLLKKTANNSYTIDTNTYLTGITSSDVTTALGYTPENVANKGVNNGYASLDGGGKVPSSQLPSYVDDVIEVSSFATLPLTGETGKIYITLDTNKIYRWSGSVYVEVSSSAAVWGGITGTLSAQNDLQSALNAKENTITAGTTAQYYRGDKSFQTLDTSVVPEGSNLYFTDARVNANGNVSANTAARHNAVTLGTANGLSLSTQVLSLGVASGSTTGALSSTDWTTFNNKYPASNPNGYTSNVGTVTSVAMTVPSAFSVSGSPITSSGTLAVTATGNTTQYIAGDGSLVTFPTIGTAGTLTREVRNTTGATLTKGTVVYISGATGNKPTVSKALATGDSTSAQTFGLVQANIANNANGNVVCVGDLTGLDTSAFTEGVQLYLSSTTAGTYTTTKQLAPNHLVYIGVVTRAHPTQGQIEVNIQNGYELYELHDVSITSVANNQGLFYEASTNLWKNKSIATVLGYTPANGADYMALSGSQTISGDKTFSGAVINDGDLYIKQDASYAPKTGYVNLFAGAGNILTYNFGNSNTNQSLSFPTNSRVYSFPDATGTLALTSDLHSAVTIGTANGLSLSTQTLSLGLASTSATGALSSTDWNTFNGKQNALTNPVTGTGTTSYIPKFTGTSAVGNSLLYDTGSVLLVGATSASDGQSKLELVSANTVGLKIISSGANGNNTFLSIQASKEWRFVTNRGDLIGGNQGDLIIRNNTDGINHIILNQGGSTTFAGALSGTSATFSGSVGIGISPSLPLYIKQVSSDGYALGIESSTDDTKLVIGKRSAGFAISATYGSTGSYQPISLYTSDTPRLNITTAGNVGIGTTAPETYSTYITTEVSGSNGGIFFAKSTTGSITAQLLSDNQMAGGAAVLVGSRTNHPLLFTVNNAERMRITSGGQIQSSASGANTVSALFTNGAGDANFKAGFANGSGSAVNSEQAKIGLWYGTSGTPACHIGLLRDNSAGSLGMTFNFNNSERMRINWAGELMIGNTNAGFSSVNRANITLNASSSSIFVMQVNSANDAYLYTDGANTYLSRIPANGNIFVTANTGGVYLSYGATSWTANSDLRLKNVTGNIENAVESLMTLKPIKHTWKSDNSNKEHLALIAQEVEKVFPQLIDKSKLNRGINTSTDETEYLGVRYTELVPVLVKAIQELNQKIKTLENK